MMTIVHNQTWNVEMMVFVNANLNIQLRRLVNLVVQLVKAAVRNEFCVLSPISWTLIVYFKFFVIF